MASINKLIDGLKAVETAMNNYRKQNNLPCVTLVTENYKKFNIEADNLDFPVIFMLLPKTGKLVYSNQGGRIYNVLLIFTQKMCYDSDPTGEQIETERELCFDMISEFHRFYNESGLFQPLKGVVNFDTDEIKTQDVNTVNVLIRFESEPFQTIC